MNLDKNLIGAAGEHLVLSRLLERGILASLAPRGTRKADILVNHLDGKSTCLIQVKTSKTGKDGEWILNEKSEAIADNDMFYCFVDLKANPSEVYVIPAKLVSKILKTGHQKWLETPGKKGQQRNNSTMRKLKKNSTNAVAGLKDNWMDKYFENWDQLLK